MKSLKKLAPVISWDTGSHWWC